MPKPLSERATLALDAPKIFRQAMADIKSRLLSKPD